MLKLNAAFWRWFGKSKVAHANGDPLVVYHVTDKDFVSFDMSKCDIGCHFGTGMQARALQKHKYKKVKTNMIGCYLSIQNPIKMPDLHLWLLPDIREKLARRIPGINALDIPSNSYFSYAHARNQVMDAGYDGIVYDNLHEGPGGLSWIAFKPSQIKAIDNDSTWDADDSDIRSNPREKITDEVVQAAMDARQETEESCVKIAGECFPASERLYDKLRDLGYDPSIVGGYFVLNGEEIDHTWVDLQGAIIDITADQFGKKFPDIWIDADKKYYRDRFKSFYE